MIRYPEHFHDCFPKNMESNQNFKRYMSLIANKACRTSTQETPEKHHIVPREWLTWNIRGFSASSEDTNNVVYLSVRDKLLSYLFLCLFFLDKVDSKTYNKLTKTVARRYNLIWSDFWSNPYLSSEIFNKLVNERKLKLTK